MRKKVRKARAKASSQQPVVCGGDRAGMFEIELM